MSILASRMSIRILGLNGNGVVLRNNYTDISDDITSFSSAYHKFMSQTISSTAVHGWTKEFKNVKVKMTCALD